MEKQPTYNSAVEPGVKLAGFNVTDTFNTFVSPGAGLNAAACKPGVAVATKPFPFTSHSVAKLPTAAVAVNVQTNVTPPAGTTAGAGNSLTCVPFGPVKLADFPSPETDHNTPTAGRNDSNTKPEGTTDDGATTEAGTDDGTTDVVPVGTVDGGHNEGT